MNTPSVSILVPIYNVSEYIERCAHSLFQQSFEDIEYVFVNDCTPDDSIEKLQKVIEQYPDRKERVKIIHHEKNRGLAAARNTALDNSTGKYVQHIDSDDWVEPDMIELMYNKAEAEQADIVVCDFVYERANSREIARNFIPEHKEDYFICIVEHNATHPCVWNKLVRRQLCELPDCRSVEGLNFAEDYQISTRWYYYAEKIVKVDKVLYHYNKMNNSALTASKTTMHYENIILLFELLGDFMKEKGLYEKHIDTLERLKVTMKAGFFMGTEDYKLMRKYVLLYRDIEMKYLKTLNRVEKIVLFLTHYKMYYLAFLTAKLIRWKVKYVNSNIHTNKFTLAFSARSI